MIFVHIKIKEVEKNYRYSKHKTRHTWPFCQGWTVSQKKRCYWQIVRVFNCSIGGIQAEQMRQDSCILHLQMCMWQGGCTHFRLIDQIREAIMRMQENGNYAAEMPKRFNRAKVWQINSIRNDLESQQNHTLPLSVRLWSGNNRAQCRPIKWAYTVLRLSTKRSNHRKQHKGLHRFGKRVGHSDYRTTPTE